jgi:hypothetical protein
MQTDSMHENGSATLLRPRSAPAVAGSQKNKAREAGTGAQTGDGCGATAPPAGRRSSFMTSWLRNR